MGDDDQCLVLHQRIDGLLNMFFIVRIDAGRCLIQQNNWCIFEDGTGNGYPLLFTA